MKKISNAIKTKRSNQIKRSNRVRAKIVANMNDRNRLAVYRSNTHIYAQIIDDKKWVTIVSASDLKINDWTKTEKAKKVWATIAEAAKKAGIEKISFDRNGYKYTGRVQALAEAARENGLKF